MIHQKIQTNQTQIIIGPEDYDDESVVITVSLFFFLSELEMDYRLTWPSHLYRLQNLMMKSNMKITPMTLPKSRLPPLHHHQQFMDRLLNSKLNNSFPF